MMASGHHGSITGVPTLGPDVAPRIILIWLVVASIGEVRSVQTDYGAAEEARREKAAIQEGRRSPHGADARRDHPSGGRPAEGLTIVGARVAQLREIAETDPQRAQDETWAWFLRLGKARDAESLDEMFRLGDGSIELEGPTDGILMMSVNPVIHRLTIPIIGPGRATQPWRGKTFDSETLTGANRFKPWFPPLARFAWPFYRGHRKSEDGEDLLFDMDNGEIAGIRSIPATRSGGSTTARSRGVRGSSATALTRWSRSRRTPTSVACTTTAAASTSSCSISRSSSRPVKPSIDCSDLLNRAR